MRKVLALIPAALLLAAAAGLPETAPIPEAAPRDAGPKSETIMNGAEARENETSERDDTAAGEPRPDTPPPPPDEKALAACEAGLRSLGARFERKPPVDGPGQCGLSATYALFEPVSGVALEPGTELDCPTALATAKWVAGVVVPSAEALGGGVELKRIRHASTYVCRNRNGKPGGNPSEHARGAAIDVSSFEFDGRAPIAVEPRAGKGSIEEAFQRAVRGGACLHFTTVLGPGSDAYHDDHMHLDLARRRSGYRLCQ